MSKSTKMSGCAWAFVAFVVIMAAAGLWVGLSAQNSNAQDTPIAYTPDASDACIVAQGFVKDRLRAPATAEFPGWRIPDCTVTQRGRIWVVNSYVDSQNAFGAMIRSDYTVEMIYYPASLEWQLVDIAIASR